MKNELDDEMWKVMKLSFPNFSSSLVRAQNFRWIIHEHMSFFLAFILNSPHSTTAFSQCLIFTLNSTTSFAYHNSNNSLYCSIWKHTTRQLLFNFLQVLDGSFAYIIIEQQKTEQTLCTDWKNQLLMKQNMMNSICTKTRTGKSLLRPSGVVSIVFDHSNNSKSDFSFFSFIHPPITFFIPPPKEICEWEWVSMPAHVHVQ